MEGIWRDIRYAARRLARNPGFTVVTVLSLALGIGANTAVFELLYALQFRGLPVARPSELAEVRIAGGNPGFGVLNPPYGEHTRPVWEEIKKQQQGFSGMFAWSPAILRVGPPSQARRTMGIRVSGDFFRVLGIAPWRGRLIVPEDEATSCPATSVVISYPYWQAEMGGRELRPDTKILADGEVLQVIGVTPPGFFGVATGDGFDLALPLCRERESRRDYFELSVMGRLRPGWTMERATAQLDAISPGLFASTAPTGYSASSVAQFLRFRLAVYPAGSGVSSLRQTYDNSLWLLLGITSLVLLIACANLANLMLARASARRAELAVVVALGASRGRLLRQLMVESGLQAALGAVAGMVLARLFSGLLVASLSTQRLPIVLRVETDGRVVLYAVLAGALTCVIFGAIPALRAASTPPADPMKTSGRRTTGSRESFLTQRLLVAAQVTVSLVLLVAALLFVRSFYKITVFNPGMREAGITVGFFDFQQAHVGSDRRREFTRDLLNEVRSTPGVLQAATTTVVPLLGGGWNHIVSVGAEEGTSEFTWVSPEYFQAMGIPVVKGRGFNENDRANSPRVAVVNQEFVRQFLGGGNSIGKTMRTHPEPDYPSTVYEIVGEIPDTKYDDLRRATPPMAFAPAEQYPAPNDFAFMMIHSKAPAEATTELRHRIGRTHPEIMMDLSDFETRIRDRMQRERLMAMLAGFFGVLATVLAMAGLYGMISYVVASRRNEIGIRLALGAKRRDIVLMIWRESAGMLAIGVVAGAALSLAAGRTASFLLFGLEPYDPATLLIATGLLVLAALLASLLPAWRAAKLDPLLALRCE